MQAPRWITRLALALTLLPAAADAQIQSVSIVQNLDFALDVTAPPGDASRLFIVGQKGDIQIFKSGALLPGLFLDLTAEVHSTAGEQGLLGLVFDPNYGTNGHFYVNFTTGAGSGKTVVRRYTVSANPDSADENSGLTILEQTQPLSNHNGGNLLFGPDGYLWIGLGDGGLQGNGQNTTTWLGKMLRLDVTGDDFPADSLRNYAIPPDNPFVGNPAVLDEIWAIGLRNPWRYKFDRLTGDLYIGDVGAAAMEEISFEPDSSSGGLNFGWAIMEGDSCFNPPTNCNPGGALTLPIYAYEHQLGFFHAVVGGYVYRGSELPASLYGHYFFSDTSWPGIWSFRYENGVVSEFTDWAAALDLGNTLKFPTAFWEDDQGELYIVEYRQNGAGEIFKIVADSTALDVAVSPETSARLQLGAARPNPFSGSTHFEIRAPLDEPVSLGVYDTAGRLVRRLHSGTVPSRRWEMSWDGRDSAGAAVGSGIYFLRAQAESVVTRRLARTR